MTDSSFYIPPESPVPPRELRRPLLLLVLARGARRGCRAWRPASAPRRAGPRAANPASSGRLAADPCPVMQSMGAHVYESERAKGEGRRGKRGGKEKERGIPRLFLCPPHGGGRGPSPPSGPPKSRARYPWAVRGRWL